jgi:hypothetical protein
MSEVEALAKDIYRIGDLILEGRDKEPDSLGLVYMPEPERNGKLSTLMRDEPAGTRDPWTACWFGHRGTGQTAEMAMLELKNSMMKVFDEMVERDQKEIERVSRRLEAAKVLKSKAVAPPNQSMAPQRPSEEE